VIPARHWSRRISFADSEVGVQKLFCTGVLRMCEYKRTTSHSLLTISHNLFAARVRPSLHSSGIQLASVLV
jgi:hypothetical protein